MLSFLGIFIYTCSFDLQVVTPVTRPKVEDNFEVVDGTLNSTGKATPTQEKKKKKEKQKTDIPGKLNFMFTLGK